MSTFTVRPSGTEKEAFRIRLTPTALLGLKLKPGDLCDIRTINGPRQAVAWDAQTIKDGIVQTSKLLQDLYGLKLGDKVEISRSVEQLQTADAVTLIYHGSTETLEEGTSFWESYAKLTFHVRHDILGQGQILRLETAQIGHDFEVQLTGTVANIAKIDSQTKFKISQNGVDTHDGHRADIVEMQLEDIGGLEAQIQQIQNEIHCLLATSRKWLLHYVPLAGILVYGTYGTGKTHLIEAIARASWHKVVRWTPGMKVVGSKIICLVTIDLKAYSRHVSEIHNVFETMRSTRTPCLILGEVGHPNDVAAELRNSKRFSIEIEIPIPDAPQRLATLKGLTTLNSDHDPILHDISQRTHGYVAADLEKLLLRIQNLGLLRQKQQSIKVAHVVNGTNGLPEEVPEPAGVLISSADVVTALARVRPSALQEVFLETPSTRWTDIGGQHHTKQQLINAVEFPLKRSSVMARFSLQPEKGVLLYGPPGCSKTLLVKALARETSVNFLAVKGAELISMYVGESERSTREIFKKARAASPCIIFFDEIDAIASRGKAGSELHVLTTLLNEMDGFEEMRNVLVVAATNKPWDIDPALMRPGRFDQVIYIGLPDAETRKEIFLQKFQKSYVDKEVWEGIDELVAHTEGYSGAEVVEIYQKAAKSTLIDYRDSVSVDDLGKAVQNTAKGTDQRMLEQYRKWNDARMA